jgi:hypothetical protein
LRYLAVIAEGFVSRKRLDSTGPRSTLVGEASSNRNDRTPAQALQLRRLSQSCDLKNNSIGRDAGMRTILSLALVAASFVAFGQKAQAQVAADVAVGAANVAANVVANNNDDWRWKYHNNRWWYYTPQNQWAAYHNNNWVYPDARGSYIWQGQNIFGGPTYYGSGYRGYANPYYGNGYYNGYYNGGYGNYYGNGYGNGYYGYGNRGANVGAAIGGALGGNRGAGIGAAIGNVID